MNGIHYTDYSDWLMEKFGVSYKSHLERAENKRYSIYFIRAHSQDFEDKTKISRTNLKIGKTDCVANMLRRREQSGTTLHIYGELVFDNYNEISTVESISKKLFKDNKIKVNCTSDEIYNFADNDIPIIMKQLCDTVHNDTSIVVKETVAFIDVGQHTDITVVAPKKKTFDILFNS